jgi:uncharacterized membrane protein
MIKMTAPLCQICGRNPATYVCQSCARTVCNNCFDPSRWSCSDCVAKSSPPLAQPQVVSFSLATWLFFIAFAMIVVGTLLMTVGSLAGSNGAFNGGAVILIGPIPIVLGTGPYSLVLIALAAVLTVIALGFFLFLRRKVQR